MKYLIIPALLIALTLIIVGCRSKIIHKHETKCPEWFSCEGLDDVQISPCPEYKIDQLYWLCWYKNWLNNKLDCVDEDPHQWTKPGETFNQGKGNGKSIALLAAVLLRKAGYQQGIFLRFGTGEEGTIAYWLWLPDLKIVIYANPKFLDEDSHTIQVIRPFASEWCIDNEEVFEIHFSNLVPAWHIISVGDE